MTFSGYWGIYKDMARISFLLFMVSILSSGLAFASPEGAAEQQALAKKDPCYGWFYTTTIAFRKTQATVARASEGQQPCAPAIDSFKTGIAPVPEACAKLKLKASPKMLLTQLKSAAGAWNKRGWQKWEVQTSNLIPAEFNKVRDFYLRELQSSCDTRK